MRKAHWNHIGLSVAIACVLSLGLMGPGGVYAAQVKKDVCHLEGTGDYHVINIAEPAWQTHYNHGDGDANGGAVPGMVGYVFDAECNVVAAVSCPCAVDGSASELNAIFAGLDFDGAPSSECIDDGLETYVQRQDEPLGDNPFIFVAALEIHGDKVCIYELFDSMSNIIVSQDIGDLSNDELEACRSDIRILLDQLPDCL